MATIPAFDLAIPEALPAAPTRRAVLWRFVRKNPLGAVGAILMLLLVAAALGADVLATHNPVRTSSQVLAAPGADFWLGSDNLGRDLYSRIVHGSRISLAVGIASTLLGGVLGGLLGLISGYLGGRTDLLLQRLMDVMQALPILVLALVLAAALGPSLTNTIIAISVVIVPRAARLIRSSVLAIREFVYVESARALGARHAGYGVRAAHFGMVRPPLLAAIAEELGDAWTPAMAGAWTAAYDMISEAMLFGTLPAART